MKRILILLALLPLLAVGCVLAMLRYAYAAVAAPERAWSIALAIDDLGNVAANGALGQTISSRAAHDRPQRWACLLCWVLDRLDPGHCDRALTAADQNLERTAP